MGFLTLSHVQMEHIKIYQSTDCLIGFERFLRLRRKLTKFMVSGTNCTIAPMLVDLSICSYGTYIGNVFFYVPPYCPHGTYVKYLFSYVPSLLYNRTYIISFSLYVPPLLYSGTYIISFSLYVSPLLYSGTYITSFSLYVPTTFHQSFSKCW